MVDSRLNSDEGGVTSSDCEGRTRPRSAVIRALRQRRTVDVVDSDLISTRPVLEVLHPTELRLPTLDHHGSGSEQSGEGQPGGVEDTVERASNEQRSRRREHDIKELRRRLKTQRAQRQCDEDHTNSSPDRDTVETRLDQLARSGN